MIPPGGEGEIKVTLKPKPGHAEITKKIQVLSNDPEQPKFALTVKALLQIDVVAEPRSLPIYNLAPGEAGTISFSIMPQQDSKAELKSAIIEDTENFSLRKIETAEGALGTFEVRYAGGEVGRTSTNVIVETTGKHTPRLSIPVHASAVYNLRYPKRIIFAKRNKLDGDFVKTIHIANRRGDAPKIKKIEDPDGLLKIEIQKAEGPQIPVRLTLPGATKQDGRSHKLILHTNDKEQPKVEMQYSARAVGGREKAVKKAAARQRAKVAGN